MHAWVIYVLINPFGPKRINTMSSQRRILIIDDNEEILVSLKSFLGKKNYFVVTASNGLDGLKLYEAANDDFDLVITDLVMPSIGGVALISIFKKRTPRLPVIAITGYGEQPESLAREAQADVVLEKPFKLDELEKIVRELIENRKA
jgi:DNA-binding NtrC family response regulator